jgi:hypothetical protein
MYRGGGAKIEGSAEVDDREDQRCLTLPLKTHTVHMGSRTQARTQTHTYTRMHTHTHTHIHTHSLATLLA